MGHLKRRVKIYLKGKAKENVFYRGIIRGSFDFYRKVRYKVETIGKRVDEKTIIFSSFNGNSYSDSPKAIYEYMINDEKFKDYTFVWAFKNVKKHMKILEKNQNTIIVKRGAKQYRKYVSIAKYWIFNFKIDDYLKPKKNQIFIQCWHGTPLKRLGCDLIHFDNVLNTVEGMQKRYKKEAKKFTYFISPSKYASEKFISAWNLKEVKKENCIIEEGYPRNDFLFNYTEEDVNRIKAKIFGYYYLPYEKEIKRKKIILYAPTYRANQHETGLGYIYKEEVDFDKLQKELGEDYIILFRAHYFIANSFDFEKYNGFVYDVSKIDDINELYVISDILITDYSSVFFDYANLKRPMIFYMYDLEHYRDEANGFYIDIEKELPGRIIKTQKELTKEIKNISINFKYDKKYEKFNKKYNYLDDGQASKRVVEKLVK